MTKLTNTLNEVETQWKNDTDIETSSPGPGQRGFFEPTQRSNQLSRIKF